ncbi:MAG: efflux RND transporter periplasmic adaptor subunit [Negativicutes bacterium]|nr:efflux RND transporter periplasmic adaptor subunit [Negativicutes bacterium]
MKKSVLGRHKRELVIGGALAVICASVFIYRLADRPGVFTPVVRDVAVAVAGTAEKTGEYPAAGTVRAAVSSQVAAQVMAKISAIYVKPGDRVNAGQVLANLDAVASSRQAQAAVSSSQAAGRAVEAAAERLRLAELTLTRYQALLAQNAIARQEYDRVLSERDVARAEYEQAVQNSAAAGAAAGAAEANAAFYTIRSPVTGLVTDKQCNTGDMTVPGRTMFVVDADGLRRVEINVGEDQQGRINVGDTVRVLADDSRPSVMARVSEINRQVDPGSRTFVVRADLPDDAGLVSGQYVKVMVPTGRRQTVVVVPDAAIVRRGELTGVFVVGAGNTVVWRIVKTGDQLGDNREILSGLTAGEEVAVSNLDQLSDGVRIGR